MHHKCHQQYIETSYQCPICLKSLGDMKEYFRRIDLSLAEHQMPSEYRNTFSHIYCNDCERKSHSKFHFMYHKCGHCLGYNTKLLSTSQGLPVNAQIAPAYTSSSSSVTPIHTTSGRELSRLPSTFSLRSASITSTSSVTSSSYTGYYCHQCRVIRTN